MKYSDVVKAGLCGILPKKKRYGSHKDIAIIDKAIRNNTAFVLKCNEIYNEEA